MTDRDYFAAAALTRGMGVLGREQIAKSCYEMADAMIRERERHHIPDAGKMVKNPTKRDATPGDGSVQGEGTVGMADIAYEAAENLQGVCKTFDQWSRETDGVMYRLARHIELLESQVPSDAEREAISLAYSRLTAVANYESIAATLKALLERTNHDAVPEAIARTDPSESSVPRGNGVRPERAATHMATARLAAANTWLQEEIKRLSLTDEEREAIEWCLEMAHAAPECDEEIATLRALLKRLA